MVGGFAIDDVPPERQDDVVGFPPADDAVWRTIEKPVVLDGRVPDPTRADEVAVSERFATTWDRPVGSTVTMHLPTPEQADQSAAGDDPGPPAGPTIEATVVGVIRSPWFADSADAPYGGLLPSPGLYATYPDNLLGAEQSQYINALVRLEDGQEGVATFRAQLAEVSGRDDIDIWGRADFVDHVHQVTGFEANALLAFALAAAIASIVLIGQSVTRYGAGTVAEVDVLAHDGTPPTDPSDDHGPRPDDRGHRRIAHRRRRRGRGVGSVPHRNRGRLRARPRPPHRRDRRGGDGDRGSLPGGM